MTDKSKLENRYRRLLALYPRAFREQHQPEMLPVLMAGAADGQKWPRRAEVIDLLGRAIQMHALGSFRRSMAFEVRHARVMVPVRMLSGLWLLILTGILCHYGYWWGLGLLPLAALHLYLASWLNRRHRQMTHIAG